MTEIWEKSIIDDFYVSNKGRVKNIKTGLIRKLFKRHNNYIFFCITRGGKTTTIGVHRLVAMAFIPNPENLPQVNHKDENPYNNAASNLEWCTNEYNNAYGTAKIRMVDTKSHPIEQLTIDGKRIAIYRSTRIAAELLGINRGTLKDAVNKNRPCKGYYWKYSDITF